MLVASIGEKDQVPHRVSMFDTNLTEGIHHISEVSHISIYHIELINREDLHESLRFSFGYFTVGDGF